MGINDICKVLIAMAIAPLWLTAWSTPARAESVKVSRSPAPPSASLNDGAHTLNYNILIDFSSTTPVRRRVRILDPDSTPVAGSTAFTSMSGASSPYDSGTLAYPIAAGLSPGRYLLQVAYYSTASCDNPSCTAVGDEEHWESQNSVQFDVAGAVGDIQVVKYEDTNGDGQRQIGEPGLPGWFFDLGVPNPDLLGITTNQSQTGADGLFTLTSVPAGVGADYDITEAPLAINPNNWTATTPTSIQLSLSSGQSQTVRFGAARPADICGTVFSDRNGDGARGAGEPGLSGATVLLSGNDGLGAEVSDSVNSAFDGGYCFAEQMPGLYDIAITPAIGQRPAGLTKISSISIASGQPSQNNDFPLTLSPMERGRVCLTQKFSPRHLRRGTLMRIYLTVRNCGPVDLDRVVLREQLPPGTKPAKIGSGRRSQNAISWRIGPLAGDDSRLISFNVRVGPRAKKRLQLQATADAANADRVQRTIVLRMIR